MSRKAATTTSIDPLKDATLNALSQLMDPLLNLMFDTGVTVREFTQLLRTQATSSATRRIMREAGTSNKSRVSILTGLPRSEVARLLRKPPVDEPPRRAQHPIRKILAAWFDDPNFLTKEGDPAVLPAFGKRKSFERLVGKYGSGVPVRAMLDELTRINAIEWLENQRIRPRHRIPLITGMTATSVSMIGERGRNLLETLLANAHTAKSPLFEATAMIDHASAATIAIGRREILQQGTNFISSADALLARLKHSSQGGRNSQGRPGKRIGVTVFYFEEGERQIESGLSRQAISHRKNLRRI